MDISLENLTNDQKLAVAKIIKEYDEVLTFHDFRMVPGETHTNLIFDVVVPAKYKKSNSQVNEELKEIIHSKLDCLAVIMVEQSYV